MLKKKKNNKVGRIEMQSQASHGAGLTHEPDAALEEKMLHVEVGTFTTLIVQMFAWNITAFL